MPRYAVTIDVTILIDAETEEEAREIALETIPGGRVEDVTTE